jgi:di/tricarboxylate transporter
MPVAIETARKAGRSPATVLMPLSFGSILGGLVTLIGTPPNIIVAAYRGTIGEEPFAMFDFAPVGLPIAVAGVAYVALVGWRLIPASRRAAQPPEAMFDIEDYVGEARVTEDSMAVGKAVFELDGVTHESDALIVGLIRGERRILAVRRKRIQAGDLLLIEAAPEALGKVSAALGLALVADPADETTDDSAAGDAAARKVEPRSISLRSDDVAVSEAVVGPRSRVAGRTAETIHFRRRYGVNLLVVSRARRPYRDRLSAFRFEVGDVLLLQGDAERLPGIVSTLGCLPLAERRLHVGRPRQAGMATGIFAAAILTADSGLVSFPVALALAAAAMVVANIVPARELYDDIDWPVVVVLGTLIPVGGALESTGATGLIPGAILSIAGDASAVVVLTLLMVVTMTLSDVMNNAATAVVAAPVGVAIAAQLGVSPDPFLMAVAVGASCAFLAPIGHQNSTLIMGPGGYRFGGYWRVGLPLEIIIVAMGVPLILWAWPL